MSNYTIGLVAPQEQVGAEKPDRTGATLAFIAGTMVLIFVGIPAVRQARMPKAVAKWPAKGALPPWHDINVKLKARGRRSIEES